MPEKQQKSTLVARLGARISAANERVKDKPPEMGPRRLPPGINNGVALLQFAYVKEQESDGVGTPKGENFFRASATVVYPTHHTDGQKIAGLVTQVVIPLCDVPEKVYNGVKTRDAIPFEQNYDAWRSLLQCLSQCEPCPETKRSDPTGEKTYAYWEAVMLALVNPAHPVYISFSTRGWTRKTNPGELPAQEIVFETWHGLASKEDVERARAGVNPAAGVQVQPRVGSKPNNNGDTISATPGRITAQPSQPTAQFVEPPQGEVESPEGEEDDGEESTWEAGQANRSDLVTLEEEITRLLEILKTDRNCETPKGKKAGKVLEKLAWENGWSEEQTGNAPSWEDVGGMALNPPDEEDESEDEEEDIPSEGKEIDVGTRWLFSKRDKDGNRLKDRTGLEIPAREVEVLTVDKQTQTCTLKTVKDGKDVIDRRTQRPVVAKWEWLEALG